MQKQNKQAAQKPLILKDWVFDKDGKQINELVKVCFLEFYFAKKSALHSHQKA
jgi:hypothetical protein